MKKILLPLLLISCFCSMLVSCDNGKYDMTPSIDKTHIPNPLKPNTTHAGDTYISATINGTHWIGEKGHMDILKGQPFIYGYYQPGDSTTYQQITLSFESYHGSGTYYMNGDGNATWFIDSVLTGSTYGQIVVDSDASGIIKGSFDFQAKDLIVTNGFFKITKY